MAKQADYTENLKKVRPTDRDIDPNMRTLGTAPDTRDYNVEFHPNITGTARPVELGMRKGGKVKKVIPTKRKRR